MHDHHAIADAVARLRGGGLVAYPTEGVWGLGCDLLPGLHHPEMHFDRAALADGVRVFKSCVRQLLG